jgi:hypothetical protein
MANDKMSGECCDVLCVAIGWVECCCVVAVSNASFAVDVVAWHWYARGGMI